MNPDEHPAPNIEWQRESSLTSAFGVRCWRFDVFPRFRCFNARMFISGKSLPQWKRWPEIDVPNMIKDVPRWDRWSLSLMQDWQREDKKIRRDGSVAVIPGGMRASVRPHSAAAA